MLNERNVFELPAWSRRRPERVLNTLIVGREYWWQSGHYTVPYEEFIENVAQTTIGFSK